MANYFIRLITKSDEAFLWEMLYHALYVPPDAEPFPQEIIHEPEIARYVLNWGEPHDSGFVAIERVSGQSVGAVWIRLFTANQQGYGYIREDIPELSIALMPDYRGQGIGTALLNHLIENVQHQYAALSLSVSADNLAVRLYQRLEFEVMDQQGTSLIMIKNFNDIKAL